MENYSDKDECSSRGACSTAPCISALEEIIYKLITNCTYYIIKLEQHGGKNEPLKKNIIQDLGALVNVGEFDEKQLYNIVQKEYQYYTNTKETYLKHFKPTTSEFHTDIDFDLTTPLNKAVALGQKLITETYEKLDIYDKSLKDVCNILLKGCCQNLSKLQDFNDWDSQSSDEIFKIINEKNPSNYKKEITNLSKIYNKLQNKLWHNIHQRFGDTNETIVSHSTKQGNAILVSGSNLCDLYNVLEKTKDTNIDIYTNSNLLIAHSFEEFKKFKNLKGHYGNLNQNSLKDFATFPGTILLTKNFGNKNEYLYRGHLYSNALIVPSGVTQILNNDYTKLIEETKLLKGFKRGKIKDSETVGYNNEELIKNLEKIKTKLNSEKIKNLYIILMNGHLTSQTEYLEEFTKAMNNDEYCIAFSSQSKNSKILSINTGNFSSLNHVILDTINKQLNYKNAIYIINNCDTSTIAQAVQLKISGYKNIYCAKCSPNFIPPLSVSTLISKFKIKHSTQSPEKDILIMRQNKNTRQ